MPRGNPKYNLIELKQRLEAACPGITSHIPSPCQFDFWTDGTKDQLLWVKAGHANIDAISCTPHPIWVRLDDKNPNVVWCSYAKHEEKILHWNKELARIGTIYSSPFNHLSHIQYAPPASTKAESLKWFTELRALTMFAFVWCDKQDAFVDFQKGLAFKVLLQVLMRLPKGGMSKEEGSIASTPACRKRNHDEFAEGQKD